MKALEGALPASMIDVQDLTFAYSGHPSLFDAFTWHVLRGEVWAILGRSGCGKSTLLTLLAGLLTPQKGEVWIGGAPLTRPRPRTGLILQDYGLLPWATVRENVALGLEIRHFYGPDERHAPEVIMSEDIRERTAYWLRRLKLEAVADHYPGQISGGQRQRTAIARTLALEPDLLLMDEPFASLDAPTREGLQELTLALSEEKALTVVLVTHAIEEAAFMGQRILLLDGQPIGSPRIFENSHAVDSYYRHSRAYQEACALIRAGLEKQNATT